MNFDNPRIHAANSPPFSCGQFLINCLSHSKHMIPCAPTEFVRQLQASGTDIDLAWKHEKMMSFLPEKKDAHKTSWHYATSFYDSMRWTTSTQIGLADLEYEEEATDLIWSDLSYDMRPYISQFFRDDAKSISESTLGFFLKFHFRKELEGFKTVFPKGKIFSVINYEKTQRMMQKKANNPAFSVLDYWLERENYKPIGFIFDMDYVLSANNDAFLSQMSEAYEYFELDDFRSIRDNLVEYKLAYIRSNQAFDIKLS